MNWAIFTPSPLRNQISLKNECGEVLNFFLYNDHKTTLTFCQVIILLFATYQAHRLLTSGLKAHKVIHASLGSRFGQQDLYLPILIEILMIYFFQYGSFGGSVVEASCLWPQHATCTGTTYLLLFLLLVSLSLRPYPWHSSHYQLWNRNKLATICTGKNCSGHLWPILVKINLGGGSVVRSGGVAGLFTSRKVAFCSRLIA